VTLDHMRERMAERAHRMKTARSRATRLWAGFGLVGALGWMIVLPMVGGAYLGLWLDRTLGTNLSFTLALMLLGLVAGGYGVWRFFLREQT